MPECVCCRSEHNDVVAVEGDRWCRQCQKDGCPQPKIQRPLNNRPEDGGAGCPMEGGRDLLGD
jgi:hypothetical protein